jgi:glucose uptake protein GlcU
VDPLTAADVRDVATPTEPAAAPRLRRLQALGILCGLSGGVWLGAAEAPTKLVTIGLSPVVVSLTMVFGVFLARWSLPALIQGTSYLRADFRQAPHLIVWSVLAGALWAVANTLTIFAIRDVGLTIAFPLWNSNSLLGIFWGVVLFQELRDAGWRRWAGVIGGALLMFAGATALAVASSAHPTPGNASRGVVAALTAGVLWGTMYIPYRKAYLTGMSPLAFITFFTVGELVTMTAIATTFSGGVLPLWRELHASLPVLFWLLLGGFVWVIGDLFQQYAVKYAGITRGIPLSNTNQLWGLLWGVLVFSELRGVSGTLLTQVLGGSIIMAIGAAVIALSSVSRREHERWRETAVREAERYGVNADFTRARALGEEASGAAHQRRWIDWLIVGAATAVLVAFAAVARAPQIHANWGRASVLVVVMLAVAAVCGAALWRTTRFS